MTRGVGLRRAVAAGLVSITMALSPPAMAQAGAGNCIVQQSAQAALQQQLAIIDASKTNVSTFFSGPNSCVSSNLLSMLDLSNLIPDLAGLFQNGLVNLYRAALDQAKQQLCRVVNGQIQDVVYRINSATGGFRSTLGGNLAGLMGVSTISLPSGVPNFGNYSLSAPTIDQLARPAAQSVYQPPAVAPAAVPAAPAEGAYPWLRQ